MNAIAVLDPTGHLTIGWNPADPEDVAQAERAVKALQAEGFTFWRTEGQGASLNARHVDAGELVRSTSHVAPAPSAPSGGDWMPHAVAEMAHGIQSEIDRQGMGAPPPPTPNTQHPTPNTEPPTPRPLAPRQQQLFDALAKRGYQPEDKIPPAVKREIAEEWGFKSHGAIEGTLSNLKARRLRDGTAPPPAAAPNQVGVATRAVRGG
jgi:hypothetical protein